MTSTYSGYLFIADISGYTSYLSASELDHAQEMLTNLLEVLIENTRPPLVISRLAGDAVISYALREKITQGQTFVEMIEATYIAFRRAIELMVLNTTCDCKACMNITGLDLKFFLHFGEFGIQRLSAHDELVGNDVNLIHRLLKNSVAETTGIRAYCLYTDAAIDKLRLEDISAAMMPHVEAYEHLGEVKTWVQDMHPVWERSRHASRVTIPPEEIMLQVEAEVAMPPNLVWDYLAQPEYRSILLGSDRQQILNRVQGRVAPGSVYHCYHGKRLVRETILEWQPFEGMTTEDLVLPNITALMKATLESMEGRTRLVLTIGKARGPLIIRTFTNLYFGMGEKAVQKDIDRFKERIEADLAERGGPAESQDLSPEAIREAVGEGLGNGGTSPS